MNCKKIIVLLFFLFFFVFFAKSPVFALEVNYPRLPGGIEPPQEFIKNRPSDQHLGLYVKYIFNLGIWIGLFLASAVIIYAGLLWLTSFNNPQRIISAKEKIISAFFGLLLLFSSYILFNTINPEINILEIPPVIKINAPEEEYIPPPELEEAGSAIYVELPLGRIIEKIFETYTYNSDPQKQKPRMKRIEELSRAVLETMERIDYRNKHIIDLTTSCSCQNTKPKNNNYCSSDPCSTIVNPLTKETARDMIKKLSEENLKDRGIAFKEKTTGGEKDIKPNEPNLKIEEEAIEKEIKELKIHLKRLKIVENFIKECPRLIKKSYDELLNEKSKNQDIVEIKFWDDISVAYKNKKGEEKTDFMTFYCMVGGSALPEKELMPSEEEQEIEEQQKRAELSCSYEIPVGEIIDKSKRIANLLIGKLEQLNKSIKKMSKAIDEIIILTSQCSSRNCPLHQDYDSQGNLYYYCSNEDDPCPRQEIKQKRTEISITYQNIIDLTEKEKPKNKEKWEEIGIIPLITSSLSQPDKSKSIVYQLIEDLDRQMRIPPLDGNKNNKEYGKMALRYPLQFCIHDYGDYQEDLRECREAVGRIGADKRTIQSCCLNETFFQNCLKECYLEPDHEKYKLCLNQCLLKEEKKAEEQGMIRPKLIGQCRHQLNFFCCSI